MLIVAPAFSLDFIEAAGMDADVNVSLLEASGLMQILDAYRAKKEAQLLGAPSHQGRPAEGGSDLEDYLRPATRS